MFKLFRFEESGNIFGIELGICGGGRVYFQVIYMRFTVRFIGSEDNLVRLLLLIWVLLDLRGNVLFFLSFFVSFHIITIVIIATKDNEGVVAIIISFLIIVVSILPILGTVYLLVAISLRL